MYKSQIKIELLSDLCVADGQGYNSSVDIDVCQDAHGLPYIPAKRLKGCLRECAQELNDWGGNIPVKELFGEEGYRRGVCNIRNAYLEKQEEYLSEIREGEGYALCHPQNILENFTYIRNQTSIDYESGTAEEKSLRSMRVVKKGLVFVADVEWDTKEVMESNKQYLEECCMIFRHMGVSRTRGFGNVKVSWKKQCEKGRDQAEEKLKKKERIPYVEGATCLTYEITLKESVICKSVNGQEQNSLDYIEGAKILGLIAERINQSGQDFADFMRDGNVELKCSNAYLQKEGVRLKEVPATIYGIKNNKTDYCDKIYEKRSGDENENRQLNPMKHCYVMINQNGVLNKYNVLMEERYHHRRPEDKSVGRADESKDSVFYQMSSICAGQKFQGFITGSEKQIRQIYDMLMEESEIQIGYGKTSEYGRCLIRVISVVRESKEKIRGSEFWLQLVSPAILYNEKAFYTTNLEDLREEIKAALEIKEPEIDALQCFVNLTTIGGYNVTWKMRKPTVEAFDKGTVVYIVLKEEVELPTHAVWIGERNAEGYGEVSIHNVQEKGVYLQKDKILDMQKRAEEGSENLNLENKPFLTEVAGSLFQRFLKYQAACDVSKCQSRLSEKDKSIMKPTVHNMLLMCRDAKKMDDVKAGVKSRFEKLSEHKQKKNEVAENILECVHKNAEKLEIDFQEQQHLKGFSYQGDVEIEYLKQYLLQLKYKLRKKSVENSSIGGEEDE